MSGDKTGLQKARVVVCHSQTPNDVALLVGCALPEIVKARATMSIGLDPKSRGPVNPWASQVLGREVRGDVVALVIGPAEVLS
jgi:hypothetical protein